MKNRKTPFGYTVKDGLNRTVPAEADIVSEIFTEYLKGKSLKAIAETLAERKVEYLPGESAWNKNRIKRMLEDIRYSGMGRYPKLIEPEMQEKALALMKEKYLLDHTVLPKSVQNIGALIRCPCCGAKMKRHAEKKCKNVRWHCSNDDCMMSVGNTDEQLEQLITEMLTKAKENGLRPVRTEQSAECELEIRRLHNETLRSMATKQKTTEDALAEVMRLASAKYSAAAGTEHMTAYINQLLKETDAVTTELLKYTTEAILPDANSVSIKLIDGNILRKEMRPNGCHRNTKKNPGHPGETGA